MFVGGGITRRRWGKYPSSICIPRMEECIPKFEIFEIFRRLDIGFIECITELPFYPKNYKSPEDPQSVVASSSSSSLSPVYKRVIIKMRWKDRAPNADFILERFREGKSVKVVYDFPQYWICLPNHQRCHVPPHSSSSHYSSYYSSSSSLSSSLLDWKRGGGQRLSSSSDDASSWQRKSLSSSSASASNPNASSIEDSPRSGLERQPLSRTASPLRVESLSRTASPLRVESLSSALPSREGQSVTKTLSASLVEEERQPLASPRPIGERQPRNEVERWSVTSHLSASLIEKERQSVTRKRRWN